MESSHLPPLNLEGKGASTGSHRRRTGWIWLLVLAAIAFAGWHFRPVDTATGGAAGAPAAAGRGRGGRGGGAPAVVVTAMATRGSIPVYLRGIGTVAPANTVTLHSRVNGQ